MGKVSGKSKKHMFQSFLYWMCYWKQWWLLPLRCSSPVSILLILDVLLEVDVVWVTGVIPSDQFQSFLYWMCYWKPIESIGCPFLGLLVSILLILDVLLEVGRCVPVFVCIYLVSILLILDVLLEVGNRINRNLVGSEFQSFLYWMCYWKTSPVI